MNRSVMSLIGVVAALGAITGVGAAVAPAAAPGSGPGSASASAVRRPIERSTLVCPALTGSDYASTTYTSYTPPGDTGSSSSSASSGGSAQLMPAQIGDGTGALKNPPGAGKPVAPLTLPGQPTTATSGNSGAAPLIGTATGRFAPGWTVQQTTTVSAGAGRGVFGMSCAVPGTDFWFPGASTASGRQDYVHLTNPDPTPAVAEIDLYDANGPVKMTGSDTFAVPGDSSVPLLLSTLVGEQANDLTVHVSARSGRLGAAVQVMDTRLGGDWLTPSAPPGSSAVLPGIPSDATSVHLVAYATGSSDANLKVRLLTPSGPITPAGNQTIDVKSGMTTSVDLGNLTRGQAGSLLLTPADSGSPAPFVAALRITRGGSGSAEMAFLPTTGAVGQRSTVADDRGGRGDVLALAAPGLSATVRITASAASDGGHPTVRTVTVQGGTTLALNPPQPSGASGNGTYAVTVEPVSGGPLYASRALEMTQQGIPMFTIQTMPDDGGMVAVPQVTEDLSILDR